MKVSADFELDKLFRHYLEKNTPYPVYTEESLGQNPYEGRCWIVDPLDGSLNYHRKIPFYTSSVGLWEDGRPLEGHVYDYSHGDYFKGAVGKIALKNGQRLFAPTNDYMIMCTGIPSASLPNLSLNNFAAALKTYKKLRWLGCASLSLCYVADGRVDGYQEIGIKVWDVAAGIAIVLAAGGQVKYTINQNASLNVEARSS